MSNIVINRLTNANIYLNGQNLIGRASSVDLPEIEQKFEEHEGLGMVGTAEFFSGIDVMECTISWTAYYPDVWRQIANPVRSNQLQIRSSLETWNSSGRLIEVPAVAFLTGTFKKLPMGSFTKNESAEFETDISCTYARLNIAGQNIFEIDVMANIYKVAGNDILLFYRLFTGA